MQKITNNNLIVADSPTENITSILIYWWEANNRDFPWRHTRDPYQVLISEILLHRTRAEQVVSLYAMFLKRFPDIKSLAKVDESELLDVLHSAGLFWRIKLLRKVAVEISERHGAEIPTDLNSLMMLPGISNYIASAIRCFAYGFPEVLLDTNTVRITGRLFGLKITDGSRRSKEFRNVLGKLMNSSAPREINWALIDFAALVCKSKNPTHEHCPLKFYCMFYAQVLPMI